MDYAHWSYHHPRTSRRNHTGSKKKNLGSTIGGEISAIISFLNNEGYALNRAGMPGLRRLLKGMTKLCMLQDPSRGTDSRARPLTSHMLFPMLLHLDKVGNKMTEMASLALGKACGLRPDNYLFTINKRLIHVGDFQWIPRLHPIRMVLNIDVGKTNKTKKVVQYIMDCTCPPKATCVVHLVRRLVRHRLHRPHEPLLLKPNGKIFNQNAQRAVLYELCKEFNLDKRYYTNYCLRVGAACEDWWANGNLWDIMCRYHWDSASSLRHYLRAGSVDLFKFIPPNQPMPGRPLPPPI